jgi:chromosome segregation ATPase
MYHLSMIDSYELGQLLRILLWIMLPAVVLFIIINTWLQYRRKWMADRVLLFEGMEAPHVREEVEAVAGEVPSARENWEMDAANERIYKGVLWMKEKYEQFRDFADRRYELVKEELARVKRQYQTLVDAVPTEAGMVVLEERNRQIGHLQRQLEEKQELIGDLQAQLMAGKHKIEELVARLQESSEHLLSIHKVLDRSVYPSSDAEAEMK